MSKRKMSRDERAMDSLMKRISKELEQKRGVTRPKPAPQVWEDVGASTEGLEMETSNNPERPLGD